MAAVIIILWVVAATVVGGLIGKHKGFTGGGIALGLVFGWLGVLIAACIPATQEKKVERAQQQMAIWAAAGQRQQMIQGQMLPPAPQQWQQPQDGGQTS